jgi:hypothetical protein
MLEAMTTVGLLRRRLLNPPERVIGAVAQGITRPIAMQAPIRRDMSSTRMTLHGIDDGSDDEDSEDEDSEDEDSEDEDSEDEDSEEDSDQSGWGSGDDD